MKFSKLREGLDQKMILDPDHPKDRTPDPLVSIL